ncbi:N-acyl homoserine lactonase family protein [Bosea sp. 2YAB26]|uniref:N-acyl homoserine lactonase family protein n=1 Tax=Bosea sp. 2YAB26 TaxID=3237478 RepID=UPI003F9365BC
MTDLPIHEVYAIRFAHHAARRRSENFLGGDAHDGPMPFDYFVFVIRGPSGAVVVDTGFNADVARTRGRQHLRCPSEGLALLGIEPASIRDVVLTHLHYDHCGNQHLFPQARFHLQTSEMAYATGPCMCHGMLRGGYDPEDIAATVRKLFEGRVAYHTDEGMLAPGITLHRVGGHTEGQQVVRVKTRKGWLVLASDATHFFENFERDIPFPWIYNVGATLEGFKRLRELASDPRLVIPGHDPQIMERFPAASEAAKGIVARLD